MNVKLSWILLSLYTCCINTSYAKKPTVSWQPVIERSKIILVGKAMISCTYCTEDRLAKFEIIEIYKGSKLKKGQPISIAAPNLSFNLGESYILFLKNEKKWIEGNSPRPQATTDNVKKLTSLISR